MNKAMETQLLKATSILYAEDTSGDREQATCFFLSVKGKQEHHYLVTNKHVLEQKVKIHLYMDQYHKDTDTFTYHKRLTIRLNDSVKYHPDYDLALVNIDSIGKLNTATEEYVYRTIETGQIPRDYTVFSNFQEILMLGYPSGICDTVSNLPVARKGITATPVTNCYKGREEFLIDIPFLSGCSGSPIFAEFSGEVCLIGIECSTLMEKMMVDSRQNRIYRSEKKTVEVETGLGIAVRSDQLLCFFQGLKKD